MTRYTNFKMRISEGQKDKLKKAFVLQSYERVYRLDISLYISNITHTRENTPQIPGKHFKLLSIFFTLKNRGGDRVEAN